MSGIFSQYKERFAPNKQGDLMNIVESDKQMFQDYKKFLNREKMQGICRHLCDYVVLKDLLVNKESFVKAFESIEKKRSLVDNLIKKVKGGDINSDEIDHQKLRQKIANNYDRVRVSIEELRKRSEHIVDQLEVDKQEDSIEELKQILFSEKIKSPFLAMKKPKILTVADLNLVAMNQNLYIKISYQHIINRKDKKAGHAVLIKKNSDNRFAFYDPNYGAVFDLTGEQLCEVVTQSFYDYIRMSKLCIVALFTLSTSVVAGIVAAVYSYNIIASVSLIICLVDLSILCCLNEKLMLQLYNTIVLGDGLILNNKKLEIALKELKKKYLGDNGKSEDAAIASDVQVKSVTVWSQSVRV